MDGDKGGGIIKEEWMDFKCIWRRSRKKDINRNDEGTGCDRKKGEE